MRIAHGFNTLEKILKGFLLFIGRFKSHKYTAKIRAVIAVLEQRNAEIHAHGVHKVQQRAGAFGEGEAQQTFVQNLGRIAAHKMPHMHLGQFIIREVNGFKTLAAQFLQHLGHIIAPVDLDAHQHPGLYRV